ncbi:MAG TPA: hypothetical protein VH678_01225 [Xanthobacteraceae bacterium]
MPSINAVASAANAPQKLTICQARYATIGAILSEIVWLGPAAKVGECYALRLCSRFHLLEKVASLTLQPSFR